MSWYRVLGIVFLICLVILLILYFVYPEYFEEGYSVITEDDGWTCLDNVNVPVRLEADGNISCLSSNGIDCVWQDNKKCYKAIDMYRATPTTYALPLVCGPAHAKHWTTTGYDYVDADGKTGAHWCQKSRAQEALGSFDLWGRIKNAVTAGKHRPKPVHAT